MISIFNPSESTSPVRWSWATLCGPDSKDFLQRLTTANLKVLPIGRGSPSCFLTAQGKIRAYFHLWNFGPGEYAFEFDAGTTGKWKNDLFAVIDQYTFGEKMTLTDCGANLESRWIFLENTSSSETPIGPLAPGETTAIDEEIRVCHHGSFYPNGPIWITAWGRPARLAQWTERSFPNARLISYSEMELKRIQALAPKVDQEITDSVLPLEIGLLDAVAEGKGCYPGQEVIEKILALGSPPRRLVLIEGTGNPPQVGEALLNTATPPAEIGQITSATPHPSQPQKFLALGLVKKIHAKAELEVTTSNQKKGVIVQVASYER